MFIDLKNLQWPSDAVTFMATEGLTPFLAWGVPVPVDLMAVVPGRAAALCACVCMYAGLLTSSLMPMPRAM